MYIGKAASCYCDLEKYGQAGRIREWIAQKHFDMKRYKSASSEFHESATCYGAHKMDLQALHCQRKEAHILGMLGECSAASQLFGTIGQKDLGNNLTKYNACESFFRSGLILLSLGKSHVCEVKENIEKSTKIDHHFETSPECDFLNNLMQILMDGSIHDFAEHVYDFDNVCPLDKLSLHLLEKVRRLIEK